MHLVRVLDTSSGRIEAGVLDAEAGRFHRLAVTLAQLLELDLAAIEERVRAALGDEELDGI